MEKLLQELNSSCVWSTVPPVQAGSDGSHLWFLTAFSSVPLPNPILHQVWLTSGGALDDATYTLLNPLAPPGSWNLSAFNVSPTSTHALAAARCHPAALASVANSVSSSTRTENCADVLELRIFSSAAFA